jgi:uncharacterized protein
MLANWNTDMALYCIHALDHAEAKSIRETHYAAHKAYLETAPQRGVTIHASGPLMNEAADRMIGSLFIIDAASEAVVTAFNADDPFARAGVWNVIHIHRFNLRRGAIGAVKSSF